MGLIGRSLDKHMRRNPVPDDDIRQALEWARSMIDAILTGENMPAGPEPYDGQVIDTRTGQIIREDGTGPFEGSMVDPLLVPFEPADETTVETVASV